MNSIDTERESKDVFNRTNYTIQSLEDEIKVDQLTKQLLQQYHQFLLDEKKVTALDAGSMASGADYFLRDYMVDCCRLNIFDITPKLIEGFAGNWYITNTLEPNMVELKSILIGTDGFYNFCLANKMVLQKTATKVGRACAQIDYYQQRIESFHNLTGDGFLEWNKACKS